MLGVPWSLQRVLGTQQVTLLVPDQPAWAPCPVRQPQNLLLVLTPIQAAHSQFWPWVPAGWEARLIQGSHVTEPSLLGVLCQSFHTFTMGTAHQPRPNQARHKVNGLSDYRPWPHPEVS
jgi:hypothetical protein